MEARGTHVRLVYKVAELFLKTKKKKKKVAEFVITLLRSVDAPTRTQTGSRVGTWDTHTQIQE